MLYIQETLSSYLFLLWCLLGSFLPLSLCLYLSQYSPYCFTWFTWLIPTYVFVLTLDATSTWTPFLTSSSSSFLSWHFVLFSQQLDVIIILVYFLFSPLDWKLPKDRKCIHFDLISSSPSSVPSTWLMWEVFWMNEWMNKIHFFFCMTAFQILQQSY